MRCRCSSRSGHEHHAERIRQGGGYRSPTGGTCGATWSTSSVFAGRYECPSEIQRMVKEALQGFGYFDVMVNNAGIQFVSPIDEFPDEKWEEIIRVDLVSCFYTIK